MRSGNSFDCKWMIKRYNWFDKILHKVALGSLAVRLMSFDVDRMIYKLCTTFSPASTQYKSSIFICGVPRSGTTILLNALDKDESIASLSYKDMPFVIAPIFWKFLRYFSRKATNSIERLHGDGIEINSDSPESFEEVFWKTFCDPSCIHSKRCFSSTNSCTALQYFLMYRRHVIASKNIGSNVKKNIYLSKNNNNTLRLKSIIRDQSIRVLLVYRNPFDTAMSLAIQHRRFTEELQFDEFDIQYLNWLGHNEFGINHTPSPLVSDNIDPALKPGSYGYWINYWHLMYEFLLDIKSDQIILVHHESMCRNPHEFMRILSTKLGLKSKPSALAKGISENRSYQIPESFVVSNTAIDFAQHTYLKLLRDPRNIYVFSEGFIK